MWAKYFLSLQNIQHFPEIVILDSRFVHEFAEGGVFFPLKAFAEDNQVVSIVVPVVGEIVIFSVVSEFKFLFCIDKKNQVVFCHNP